MLPLDHIPFQGPDLAALAGAFAALGFTVTPPCSYTSPDYPDARWRNHCVFMDRGWFDLLHAPGADPVVRPGGALFLTDDLQASAARLEGMRQQPPYGLVRGWDEDPDRRERFTLFSIRERISPLGLAVIEHHYPCPDALLQWFSHPNTAIEAAGLIFSGVQPGPFAEAAAQVLDLAGFEYWDQDRFHADFGEGADCAVRVRVSSLQAVRNALAADLIAVESKGRLHVAPPSPLGCGFQFFEA